MQNDIGVFYLFPLDKFGFGQLKERNVNLQRMFAADHTTAVLTVEELHYMPARYNDISTGVSPSNA